MQRTFSESQGDTVMQEQIKIETTNSRRLRKSQLIWAATAVGAVALYVGIVPRVVRSHALQRDKEQAALAVPRVFVAAAQPVTGQVSLQLSGSMSPITEVPVLARVDGYLKKRFVDIGDKVHAGQILGMIAAPDLDQQVSEAASVLHASEANLEQSKSALDQANANAGIAAITAERWAALLAKGAVSQQASDNYQFAYGARVADVGVATASVASATNTALASRASLRHYRELQAFESVRAPFDGVITERNVDDGVLVTATTTLLFRVSRDDKLRTFVDVPQVNAPSIHLGSEATLRFVQFPDRMFRGNVVRTANSLTLDTRTLLTEIDVENLDGALLPGMYATVSFDVPRASGSVVIPGEALRFRSEGTTVAIVDDKGVVHERRVTIGRDYGATLEITEGLTASDRVVVNPDDVTVEGTRVNPVPIQTAAQSLAPPVPPSKGGKNATSR